LFGAIHSVLGGQTNHIGTVALQTQIAVAVRVEGASLVLGAIELMAGKTAFMVELGVQAGREGDGFGRSRKCPAHHRNQGNHQVAHRSDRQRPQGRHGQSEFIRMTDRPGTPGRRRAAGAAMLGVAIEGFQHAGDQRLGIDTLFFSNHTESTVGSM